MAYFFALTFCFIGLVSGLAVVLSKNAVYSVLNLILVFCVSACLLLMEGFEFLGLIFIVVYVGAIAVLFLFVVMMLDIKLAAQSVVLKQYIPFANIVAFLSACGIGYGYAYFSGEFRSGVNVADDIIHNPPFFDWVCYLPYHGRVPNMQEVGELLYTYLAFSFIVSSMILLVALVGSIVLTLYHSVDVKRQDIFTQSLRNRSNSYRRLDVRF